MKLIYVLMLCFLFCCCHSPTKIEKLLLNPTEYYEKTVTIEGQVVASANYFFIKGYFLQDETGTIAVKTYKSVPLEGAYVRVSGELKQQLKINTTQLIYLCETKE